MHLAVHLLGNPRIERPSGEPYQVRSRKSWALLAYALLSERPPSRYRLAALLYPDADDPLRALRWTLSEIRRALGDGSSIGGDPVVLELPSGAVVDVRVVTSGTWPEAVRLPGLGEDLLDGYVVKGAAAFGSWLLSEQRHVAAAAEAILHEAALGSLSRGKLPDAIAYAVRATAMNPLDENHQALLIRLYRLAGDVDAAQRQFDECAALLADELGVDPGGAVVAANREPRREQRPVAAAASVRAIVEAGSAAVAAGAVQAGVDSLRSAVPLADRSGSEELRVSSRLVLAEALIHALGGLDEEGLASLHEADQIAGARGDRDSMARARTELGYVDFLRGRYDRAEHWLTQAVGLADGSPWLQAKATTYLGSVESDRANYPRALALLDDAVELARAARDPRREAYAFSMIGRVHLLRLDLETATQRLDAAIALAEDDHWLSFLPWPQALLGHAKLAASDVPGALASLEQAFARACQLRDPCWEGIAARGVALAAAATGDVDAAFAGLIDARVRCGRLADPYVWLDAYILDALCGLGRIHGHPNTRAWVQTMHELTSRTWMRELSVRSLRHGAALGESGAAEAARLLASNIDNPAISSDGGRVPGSERESGQPVG